MLSNNLPHDVSHRDYVNARRWLAQRIKRGFMANEKDRVTAIADEAQERFSPGVYRLILLRLQNDLYVQSCVHAELMRDRMSGAGIRFIRIDVSLMSPVLNHN